MRAHQVRPYGPSVNTDKPTSERSSRTAAPAHPGTPQYEIRVAGHLGARWAAWFDGLILTDEDDGTTVLCGPVVDQAALHGLLQKLRDAGIPLLSLTPVSPDRTSTPGLTPRTNEGN